MRAGLLAWQWQHYDRNHRDRLSLLLHFVTVPLFVAGVLAAVRLASMAQWAGVAISVLAVLAAVAVQAWAHRREAVPPEPFDGPLDAVARIFAEQFVTFPRFLLSGGWIRNLAAAGNTNTGRSDRSGHSE